MGAEGIIADLGDVYLTIIVAGSVCQIFGTGVVPLIRNKGGAVFAMVIMMTGFLVNILLDYMLIWVYDMGLAGASIATLAGQFVTAAGGVIYLVSKKTKLLTTAAKWKNVWKIIKVGISSFGITMCPCISLLLMNRFLVSVEGNAAVACYAVLTFLRGYIGPAFGASEYVSKMISEYMPIIMLGFMFLAVSRIVSSFFYAIEEVKYANIIVYSEEVFLLILLILSALLFGEKTIWGCMTIAQVMSCILSIVLIIIYKYNNKKPVY